MTRDEIKALKLGEKIQLINGPLVSIQGIDQEKGQITFQYVSTVAIPKTTSSDIVPGYAGYYMQTNKLTDGGIPPAPVVSSQLESPLEESTTVICDWAELVGATKLT